MLHRDTIPGTSRYIRRVKIEAVINMPKPKDVKDVRRLCGFVNYLTKFMPNKAEVMEPLRQLTHKEAEWKWMHEHDAAIEKIKRMVTTAQHCLNITTHSMN